MMPLKEQLNYLLALQADYQKAGREDDAAKVGEVLESVRDFAKLIAAHNTIELVRRSWKIG